MDRVSGVEPFLLVEYGGQVGRIAETHEAREGPIRLQVADMKEIPHAQRGADPDRHTHEPRMADTWAIISAMQAKLSDIPTIVIRHGILLGVCALTGAAFGFFASLSTQPVYRANTSVNIQNLDVGTTDKDVQTQVELLRSDMLLKKTTASLKAEQHPLFLEQDDALSRLRRMLHVHGSERISYDAAVDRTVHAVAVTPQETTHGLEITCDSLDAALAAKFCNTLVAQDRAEEIATRGDAIRVNGGWLDSQIAVARRNLQESQRLLGAATGKTADVPVSEGKAGEDRLRQLRAELLRAEDDRMRNEEAANASQGSTASDLAAAKHREMLLALTYDAQEANVAGALKERARIELLRREVESEQAIYETLLQQASLASGTQPSTVRVLDPARVPLTPITPWRGEEAAAGLALGSIVGLGLALYKDRQAQVFRGPGDVQRLLHLDELGLIPSMDDSQMARPGQGSSGIGLAGGRQGPANTLGPVGRTRWDDPSSIAAESYRSTAYSLMKRDAQEQTRVYTVSSPGADEGGTAVASNLGVAFSKLRLRVLVIDGDLRAPSLHTAFSVENDYGLRNILGTDLMLAIAGVDQLCTLTRFPNLQMMPSGTGSDDPIELLKSPRLAALLKRLSKDFDVILIHTPPILSATDASLLASSAQGAILVVRLEVTGQRQAMAARDLLVQDGIRIVGCVLDDYNAERGGRNDRSRHLDRSGEREAKSA